MSDPRRRPSAAVFRAANRVVRPLLRSPLHPLLSRRLMLVTYTGAKTGRRYTVPVARYTRSPGEVWAFAARTGWASNLRGGRTVRLRLQGREVAARPAVEEDRRAVADLLRELIALRGPRVIQDPALGLPRDREPTREQLLAAAEKTRIVRFTPIERP